MNMATSDSINFVLNNSFRDMSFLWHTLNACRVWVVARRIWNIHTFTVGETGREFQKKFFSKENNMSNEETDTLMVTDGHEQGILVVL